MRVAIYTPYLDTVGGGEKYMLTIASILSKTTSVDILLDTHLRSLDINQIKARIQNLHQIDLSGCRFLSAPFGPGSSNPARLIFLAKYDYLFYLTDGSIFFSTAKNNILHFQVPFTNLNFKSIQSRIKLSSWQQAIYNSKFTQEIIEKSLKIKGSVVYPPIDIKKYSSSLKKKQIISVGRFVSFTKSKKHEILIDSFISISKKLPGWSLHLAGGAGEGDNEYVESLRKRAKGSPVQFYPNIKIEDLITLYSESSLYWHAAGYGEVAPEKFEHFGITTVEAMASGCVPVVINLGGQPEIVDHERNGYLWNTLEELEQYTLKLAGKSNLLKEFSKESITKAKVFDQSVFEAKIKGIIK